MPRTADASEGPLDEEAIDWEEQTSDPAIEKRTQFVQNKGLLTFVDGVARSIGETRQATWQTWVDDESIDTPPGSPTAGDRVIVGGTPTGVFVGHAGEIAQYNGTSWVFSVPVQGSAAYVRSHNVIYVQKNASSPWNWEATNLLVNIDSGAEPQGSTLQTDGAGGIQLATVVSGYPPEFDYAVALTEQSTTSATFIPALEKTTNNLSLGAYIVLAQATIRGSLSSTVLGMQSQIDNTETFGEFSAVPGVKDGDFQFFSHIVKPAWSGVHQIDVDYRRQSGGGEAKIRNCRITLWKVGN